MQNQTIELNPMNFELFELAASKIAYCQTVLVFGPTHFIL